MIDISSPKYFLNREWSWLEFNNRVYQEACLNKKPLLERLKFFGIAHRNLEEFYTVRVAALTKQVELGVMGSAPDQHSPEEQLKGIDERVRNFFQHQHTTLYKSLLPALTEAGIEIIYDMKKTEEYRDYFAAFFDNNIKKVLTPISVGPTHPFPNLISGELYLTVGLHANKNTNEKIERGWLSFIQIPTNIYGRFVKIEGEEKYVPLENIIKLFVKDIYYGYDILSLNVIKIARDADFDVDDDVSDLLAEIESQIRSMHMRSVVRMDYEEGLPESILKFLIKELKIGYDKVFRFEGMLNLHDLLEIYSLSGRNDLKDLPIQPIYPTVFSTNKITETLRNQEVLLFHPYHSYDPVVQLIEWAADDPNVLAIKLTLYRTSSHSKIISALERAAQNGKYVTILDELKARGDEKRNIETAKRLEDAGAHVIYGIAGLKTHTKAMLIIRKEKSGIRRYVHLATGNYNEATARQYTDFSLFTSDQFFGEDISNLFNLLTGFSLPTQWNYVSVAPLDLRDKILALIKRETEYAINGVQARIVAKMNSLLDLKVIQELYKASMAGVKIDLLVRGICALRPQIKGLSDNITVKSIIGKFLEHARIYYFYNGGDEEYYLSSADWMVRNLDRRVELLFPIHGKEEQTLIKNILDIQFNDTVNSWTLNSDGNYSPVSNKRKVDSFSEIYHFIREREEKLLKYDTSKQFRVLTNPKNR